MSYFTPPQRPGPKAEPPVMRVVEPANYEEENFILINTYEAIVRQAVGEMIHFMDICRCEKCVKDACALVLNQLPHHYVTTRRGTLLSVLPQMSMQKQAELSILVTRALKTVGLSPQHDNVQAAE